MPSLKLIREETQAPNTEVQIRPRSRNKFAGHTTVISNVILSGYKKLSDGAKLTYIILESYDWPRPDGTSKGAAWPSIKSLAAARGKSYDTIQRHLKELAEAGLITIDSGKQLGQSNIYWLEEPSEQEIQNYQLQTSCKNSNRHNLKVLPTPPLQTNEPTAQETAETKDIPASGSHLANTPLSIESNSRKPEKCGTGSGKNAAGGTAKMPDIRIPNQPESKNKDSNRVQQSQQLQIKSNSEQISRSTYVSRVIEDFSRLLHDQEHLKANQVQANRLFHQSGLSEKDFVTLLYEAKKRTQWAAIAQNTQSQIGPNRGAYFFKVVRSLLDSQPSDYFV